MLKTTLCLVLFLTFSVNLFTQTTERDVLANAGGTATLPNDFTFSWTLGEAFVATRQNTPTLIVFTEGFQQPEDAAVSTIELPDALGQIIISPNPAGDVLFIALSALPNTPLRAVLLDLNGRSLRETLITDLRTSFSLLGLPAAGYVLSITNGKGWAQAVQVLKR